MSVQLDAEMVGCQWGHYKRPVVHVGDIAQQGLIDGTSQRKAEVGVLAIAHVRETLVRHRFQNGTGNLGQARLRVVAVVEFATLPFTIFINKVLRFVVQQRLCQLIGNLSGETGVELHVVVVGGTDGQ